MEMHAYSEDYLLTAPRILGDMLDYAVNEYEFDPDEFYKMFLVSDVSRQFQEGNPDLFRHHKDDVHCKHYPSKYGNPVLPVSDLQNA